MNRTGLILAGGISQRFGESKPLAVLDGRPLVRWVGDALRSRCDELVVSIGVKDDPTLFREAVPGARIAQDAHSQRGPIEGFLRGFDAARGDLVLVAPGDAPLLQPSLYDGLLAILGNHEVAVPRHAMMDPVRAVYRRDAVLRGLSRGPRSPSALIDLLDAVYLEGDALRAADPAFASFVDVNRREDLEQAHRVASNRS